MDLFWRLLELEPGMEVLDLACGHGRISNRLAERGCRVTGLDVTELFLDRAREDARARGVIVEYVRGRHARVAWTGRFDPVINWFTAFGFFDDAGNRLVLAEISRALRPGGWFAVDLSNLSWLMRNYQPALVVDKDGDLLIDRNTLDLTSGRNLVKRTTVRGRIRRDVRFFVRLFAFTELRAWLEDAGLRHCRVVCRGGYG